MILTIPIVVIINLIGIISVKAETVNFTYGKWRANDNGTWTSVENFGTNQERITLNGISARFGWSTKFQAGTTYRVVIESGFKLFDVAISDIGVLTPISVNCFGSTSTSSWSADSSLIANCDYIGATKVANSNHVKYVIDITPLSTIIGLQVNINYDSNDRYMLTSVNTYTSSAITYGESISSVIDEQTITIVNNNNENTQEIINNQNENTKIIMESQKICTNQIINKNTKVGTDNGRLMENGTIQNNTSYFVTDYIEINEQTEIKMLYRLTQWNCFYNEELEKIGCYSGTNYNVGDTITIPNNTKYVRFTIYKTNNNSIYNIHKCLNGNQAIIDQDHEYNQENPAQQEQQENESLSETITDYFDDFQTGFEYHITIPTQSANFIWTIINRLTQMEIIRTYMISILCLGLVKMVLNR